ncbi:hypothetical protein [Membranihabitans marinus]|uniref:hypothetical protein n=1 Tax=Membranihabitans marinus TaxID=1227546 RepID=UPI001F31FDBA|nr:hypothetical protein [Membranihabitans marinus]
MFLFFLLGLLVTVYIINKIYFGKTTIDHLRKELDKTKKIYKNVLPSLVHWSDQEIELLSYHVSGLSERKGFGQSIRGVFTSIYQENMLVFQHRPNDSKKKNGYTILISEGHEIIIDGKNQVYVNGEILGLINKKNQFVNPKLRRNFGFLEEERFNKHNLISEDKEILGAVKNPEDWELPFPRALELYQPLDDHYRLLLKILCGHQMVKIYADHLNNK